MSVISCMFRVLVGQSRLAPGAFGYSSALNCVKSVWMNSIRLSIDRCAASGAV